MWLLSLPAVTAPDALERVTAWEERCAVSHAGHFAPLRPSAPPFSAATKPRRAMRVALATSGGVHTTAQPAFDMVSRGGDDSIRWIPADAEPSDLRFADDHYDHSEPDADPNCMFPLHRLRELADEGFIGSTAPRHLGFMGFVPDPTRFFTEIMPAAARQLVEDGVDAVVFSPGCPMCHRTVALAQHAIEAAGIPTVSLTLAPSLTLGFGVPRALRVRFPFGNAFGERGDRWTQRAILKALLDWLTVAPEPNDVRQLPYSWATPAVAEDQDDCVDGACFVPRPSSGSFASEKPRSESPRHDPGP